MSAAPITGAFGMYSKLMNVHKTFFFNLSDSSSALKPPITIMLSVITIDTFYFDLHAVQNIYFPNLNTVAIFLIHVSNRKTHKQSFLLLNHRPLCV